MRSGAIILLLILTLGAVSGQEVSDLARTGLLLGDFTFLQLAPGEEGDFSFSVANPYSWPMENVTLEAEIYVFVLRGNRTPIQRLSDPPIFTQSSLPSTSRDLGTMAPASRERVSLTIHTFPTTPSGSFFTQGAYHVRFRLEFDYLAGLHAVMVSPGFYSPEEFAYATRDVTPQEQAAYRYVGFLNLTYLGEVLGLESIDGVVFDSGFGMKVPRPLWPFQLLLVGAGVSAALALYHVWRDRRTAGESAGQEAK